MVNIFLKKKQNDNTIPENIDSIIKNKINEFFKMKDSYGTAYEAYSKFDDISSSSEKLVNFIISENNKFSLIDLLIHKKNKKVEAYFISVKESLLSIKPEDFDCFDKDNKINIINTRFQFINSVVNVGVYYEQRMLNQNLLWLTFWITLLTIIIVILTLNPLISPLISLLIRNSINVSAE